MFQRTLFLSQLPSHLDDLIVTICQALAPVGTKYQTSYVYVGPETRSNGVTRFQIVDVVAEHARIDIVPDASFPTWYLVVMAATDKLGIEIVNTIAASVPTLSPDDLLAIASAPDRAPSTLIALGMSLSERSTPRADQVFLDALKDVNPEIRYGAAVGASFLRSRSIADALAIALASERDESIARVMTLAESYCRKPS